MSIPSHLLSLPEGYNHTNDPIGANPFKPGSAIHDAWTRATRVAEERALRVEAEALANVPANVDAFNAATVTRIVALFDIWTERFVNVVAGEKLLAAFDEWLFRYTAASLQTAAQAVEGSEAERAGAVEGLRGILASRLKYWKAEARRFMMEVADQGELSTPVPDSEIAEQRPPSTQVADIPAAPEPLIDQPANDGKIGGPRFAIWLRAKMAAKDHITVRRLAKLAGSHSDTIKILLAGGRVKQESVARICEVLHASTDDYLKD